MGSLLTLLRKKGGPFSPLDLPGLALWLDASDLSTITHSSGAVSQWDDKSGNGRHVTQGTAANQPTTGTRTLNGRNVLDFDGTNDSLATPSSAVISQPNTVIVVAEADVMLGEFAYIVDARDAANSSQRQILGFTSASRFRLFAGSALDQGTASAGTPYILTGVVNGASSALYANGSSVASGNAGSNGLDLIRVGSERLGSVYPFNGKIAEVIVCGALTAGQRGEAEAALATKWGVTLA